MFFRKEKKSFLVGKLKTKKLEKARRREEKRKEEKYVGENNANVSNSCCFEFNKLE